MLCVRFIFKGPICVSLTAVKHHTATFANACFEKGLLQFVFTTFGATQACKCKKHVGLLKVLFFVLERKPRDGTVWPLSAKLALNLSNPTWSFLHVLQKRNTERRYADATLAWIKSPRCHSCRGVDPSAETRAGAFQRRVSIGHHWFKAHMRAVIEPVANTFRV